MTVSQTARMQSPAAAAAAAAGLLSGLLGCAYCSANNVPQKCDRPRDGTDAGRVRDEAEAEDRSKTKTAALQPPPASPRPGLHDGALRLSHRLGTSCDAFLSARYEMSRAASPSACCCCTCPPRRSSIHLLRTPPLACARSSRALHSGTPGREAILVLRQSLHPGESQDEEHEQSAQAHEPVDDPCWRPAACSCLRCRASAEVESVGGALAKLAIGETVILEFCCTLLSPFSRCFNRDGVGVSVK